MRAYFFGNYYLSSIQQGIQAAHCAVGMFVRHTTGQSADKLFTWAQEHKTIVCLNGGNAAELRALWENIRRLGDELDYPCNCFHEDTESLDNTMTCVGIIVPEKIYLYNDYERELRKVQPGPLVALYSINPVTLNTAEKELAQLIAAAPLAR